MRGRSTLLLLILLSCSAELEDEWRPRCYDIILSVIHLSPHKVLPTFRKRLGDEERSQSRIIRQLCSDLLSQPVAPFITDTRKTFIPYFNDRFKPHAVSLSNMLNQPRGSVAAPDLWLQCDAGHFHFRLKKVLLIVHLLFKVRPHQYVSTITGDQHRLSVAERRWRSRPDSASFGFERGTHQGGASAAA